MDTLHGTSQKFLDYEGAPVNMLHKKCCKQGYVTFENTTIMHLFHSLKQQHA